jgi:tetratricopeptide (TPR) repeat protein
MLLILGMASRHRTLVYESEEIFWTDMLAKNPNCWMVYNNLGNALLQKGLVDVAPRQFRKALERNSEISSFDLAKRPNYIDSR